MHFILKVNMVLVTLNLFSIELRVVLVRRTTNFPSNILKVTLDSKFIFTFIVKYELGNSHREKLFISCAHAEKNNGLFTLTVVGVNQSKKYALMGWRV